MKFKEIIIELSHNCNLSCTMCGFGYKTNPISKEKFMSFEMFKSLTEKLAPQTETMRLNGRGESTIHPQFCEILNYLRTEYPKLNINLFSNMSAVNDEILHILINANVQLFISLDSTDKATLESIRVGANFEKIISNIEKLKIAEKRPFVVMTVQEKNLSKIQEMGKFALEHHCHIIYNTIRSDEIKYIQGFIDKVRANPQKIADDFIAIKSLYSKTDLQCLIPDQIAGIPLPLNIGCTTHGSMEKCPALESELCILYDGKVTPCNMFNPFVYGSLKNDSLESILKSAKRALFQKTYKQ